MKYAASSARFGRRLATSRLYDGHFSEISGERESRNGAIFVFASVIRERYTAREPRFLPVNYLADSRDLVWTGRVISEIFGAEGTRVAAAENESRE